jgi:hypothetical protein
MAMAKMEAAAVTAAAEIRFFIPSISKRAIKLPAFLLLYF